MKKHYKSTHISPIETEQLWLKDMITRKRAHNRLNEKTTIARVKRTWPISSRQYEELFGEEPFYTDKLKYFKIINISDTMRSKQANIHKFKSEKFIYLPSNPKTVKFYHNYTNIDNIIHYKKKKNINIINIRFDDEFFHILVNWINEKYIKPDWILLKWNTIYFLETDMWTETYSRLKEKDEAYIKMIRKLEKEKDFEKFKVLLYTTNTRVINLHKQNTFENLSKNGLIEYYWIWN